MKQNGFALTALTALLVASSADATTPAELMSQAIRSGKASGELTGAVSDDIKSQTHSTAPTFATFERMSIDSGGCHVYKFTLIQNRVPNRAGQIVGDYLTVSKNKVCPDDREQAPPEVIDCHIGGVSCMPPKASIAASGPPFSLRPK